MSIQDRIAALPEWPKDMGRIYDDPALEERKAWGMYDAALARLALAVVEVSIKERT